MRRWLLLIALSGIVALLMPAAASAATAGTAEFMGGTVKIIPANSVGLLDTGNFAEFRFHYGNSVFAIPYQNITGTQVVEPVVRHIWRVPVPKIGEGSRFLTITYREGEDSRMLTFKAPTGEISRLVRTIDERRKGPAYASDKASLKTDTEAWWGDKYWRTTRNKPTWPSESDSQGVQAGTKY